MAAKMSAETPITDFSDGSVVLTLLETAAQEDFQQYVQMLNIIRAFNLDTTEGEDLDNRGAEFGLTRIPPIQHSGFITVTDTRFTKISSKIYAGLAGPTAGSFVLNVDDASTFPSSGSVFIGRGTVNSEGSITYSGAPVDNGAFWTITLDLSLANDHGTDETVVLAQFGDRTITAGEEVEIPESDVSDKVLFELNQTIIILDGEDTIENVLVTALEAGGFRVPANSIVSFPNDPFTGAAVTNPLPFVNGRDLETDQQFRDRIRDTIQSLSKGTPRSIQTSIVGLIDESTNSSIVSANIIPPVVLADGPSKVFIDNGRGLEPEFSPTGLETVLLNATGGESFVQLDNFPLVKANVVSQNIEPFNLVGLETLIVNVGTDEETFTFLASDFTTSGSAEATEIAEAINNRANLIEARTITDSEGRRVFITPVARSNENLQIDESSTANTALNFSTLEILTLKLYKNDQLLTKDGLTASLLSDAQPFDLSTTVTTTSDGDLTITSGSAVVTKSLAGTEPFKQFIHPGDYIRLSTDSDSFYTRVRTVVSDTKLILEDTYPVSGGGTGDLTIWNSPQLEVAANGDRDETEIVSFAPNDFATPSVALADDVLVRMQAEINLSTVELAVNDTKLKIISNLENSADSKMQVLGGAGAIALGYCTSEALTGTLTFTGGEVAVTGTSTVFTTELQEGQWIKANADGNGSWTKIETIEDDTTLYLTTGYRGEDRSAVASGKTNFSELNEGSNADYSLNRSNGQIEFNAPLVAGDDITAGSVNTRAFLDSSQETFDFDSLGASSTLIVCVDGGFPGTVTTGDGAPPHDTFIDTSLIGFEAGLFTGFFLEWTNGNNLGETDFVASYDTVTGTIITVSGATNPVLVGDRFIMCQVLTFTHASDFADPVNATSAEVVTAINAQLLGGLSEELEDTSVRIRTTNFGEDGKIQVKGGTANTVLGFSTTEVTNQLANVANAVSRNSDRGGNPAALGYTLGPDQTLVIILDDDSANKTFSVTMDVDSTVTTGGSGTFADSGLSTDFPTDDFFNDFWVYWLSGINEGNIQRVTDYVAATGTFTVSDVFGATGAISIGDTLAIVPRTAENVVDLLNDFNVTTFSIVGTPEVTGISGDFVQLSTKTPGSEGKVFVTGGTANGFGIAIEAIPAGAPTNDVTVNSIAGLTKGLITSLTVDGTVTTGDAGAPFDTFIDTSMITAFPGVFTGLNIEFLTGTNAGLRTTISSYTNTTGEIVLTTAASNSIDVGDTFRIDRNAFIDDITGASSPFTVELVDSGGSAIDTSVYTSERSAAIRSLNGLNFLASQVEGIDGYKFFTGLIQKAQFTIDGLDSDPFNFPGEGAAGTQFEVLTPVLVKLELIVDITTDQGVSISSISNDVSNAILNYVNSLPIGGDVILSEIVAAAQSIDGVFDVSVSNFTDNITIADGELARLDDDDLTIG